MSKNIDEKVDELEAAKERYLSENTVISIGGYAFTPAKLMIAGTIVTTILGGLYGAFEVYKDYQDMKTRITEYVAPDLSEFDKRLEVINKEMASTKAQVEQATEYTNNIKNDLKADIRRLENVVDNVERTSKQSQRETDLAVKDVRDELRRNSKEMDKSIVDIRREVDAKIKKALDNPLANQ